MNIKAKMITALFLIVCLFYTPVFAVEGESASFDGPISFLRAVGILEAEDYAAQEAITKSEAVSMVMRLLGYNASTFGQNAAIRDVEESNPESGLLKAAVELGIVELDENYLFNPNSLVSYADAAKMVFMALGYQYTSDTEKNDAWYLQLAAEHRLDGNVVMINNGKLTKGEWAGILYNAAHIPVMQGIAFEASKKTYRVNEDVTALSEYLHIYIQEGVMTANSVTSLREKTGAGNDTILVGGLPIQTEGIAIDQEALLGKDVQAYYRQDTGSAALLVYIQESGKTQALTIASDELVGFNFRDYIYTYNNSARRNKTVSISKSAAIIYNGIAVTDEDLALLNEKLFLPETGEVELVASSHGSTYDVVKIKSYTTYVVDTVSKTENLIFDKYDKEPLDISPETWKTIDIYDMAGEPLTISNLEEWDILAVAVSSGGEYTEIVVSGNAVTGIITEIMEDALMLEQEEFEFGKDLLAHPDRVPEVGTEVVAYLDPYGKIAAVQIEPAGDWQVAYLIAIRKGTSLDEKIQFKLLTQDSVIAEFESAFPLVVDGSIYREAESALDVLAAGGIIRYRLNPDGQIKRIDTPVLGERENPYSLQQRYAGSYKFKNYVPTFGGVVFPKSSAMVFTVPADADGKERDYVVENLNAFVHDSTYNIVAYAIGDNDLTEDIILHKKAGSLPLSTREVMTLVTKITRAVDEDGMVIQKLYGMNSGGNREWTIDLDDPTTSTLIAEKDIKPGDLIRVTADNRMRVSQIQKVFDGTTRTMHEDIGGINPNAQYDSVFTVSYGKVTDRANGLIQVELYNDAKTVQKYKEGGTVFVCEDGDNIRKGSFDDIIPEVSSIVVDMNYSRVRTITIYK